MMIDLVVQAAELCQEESSTLAERTMSLRLARTCRENQSMRDSFGIIGIPLWLGADQAPM